MASSNDTIRFLVDNSESDVRAKGSLPGSLVSGLATKVVDVTTDAVAEGIADTLDKFREILTRISDNKDGYSVSEVKISLAVDSRGEVSVVSVGKGSLGGRAELQFTLKRET